jgi:hypothetical protein
MGRLAQALGDGGQDDLIDCPSSPNTAHLRVSGDRGSPLSTALAVLPLVPCPGVAARSAPSVAQAELEGRLL